MAIGRIVLFGSGETSRHGRQIHHYLLQDTPKPVRIAILETPAGFQPNVSFVSGKLRAFFEKSLQNFQPTVQVVAARRRGGVYDPDSPIVVAPLLDADYIFAGPGSPTYTVRQLANTLAYKCLCERHEQGAILSFSSAAALALGRFTLPVYEIYKAGEDLGWHDGLDFFRRIGLDLAVVPHWNNTEGGNELDTSCCFMGQERFAFLRRLLPSETTVLGIDEHTACIFEPGEENCRVMGVGSITIVNGSSMSVVPAGESFPFRLLATGD